MESVRRYIDLKLYLTRPSPEFACQVALLPTPEVGESEQPVLVPKEQAPSRSLLERLDSKVICGKELVQLGQQLCGCLLPEEGGTRELFRSAVQRAGSDGGVRLRLVIASPELESWPWEYVYLQRVPGPALSSGFLVLDPRISLVRHTPLRFEHPSLPPSAAAPEPLRIGLFGASPADPDPLAVDKELRQVQDALTGPDALSSSIRCLPVVPDVTEQDLEAALLHPRSMQILHYSGHASAENRIDPLNRYVRRGYLRILRDKASRAPVSLPAERFAKHLIRGGVRLAVLSACRTGDRSGPSPWSSVAGALIAERIPAVVAMQSEIGDKEAADFGRAFYAGLAAGLSLDEALSLGRGALFSESTGSVDAPYPVEWGVPVLYSRMPEGRLLPERMSQAGAEAQALRSHLQAAVRSVENGAVYTGIHIGSIAADASVSLTSTTESVRNAKATGIEIDRIG